MKYVNGNKLKTDLEDYFGSGMATTGSPFAMMELERVRHADGDDLMDIAEANGFDLEDYVED